MDDLENYLADQGLLQSGISRQKKVYSKSLDFDNLVFHLFLISNEIRLTVRCI